MLICKVFPDAVNGSLCTAKEVWGYSMKIANILLMVALSAITTMALADQTHSIQDLEKAPIGSQVRLATNDPKLCFGQFGSQWQEGKLAQVSAHSFKIGTCEVPKEKILFVQSIRPPKQ